MSRALFGTDGIRGRANSYPMTAEMALRLGAAAGRYFQSEGQEQARVVIGKDTRLSGYMFETALTAGLTSLGMSVLLLGPVPTPAVGYLTRSMRADLGIMISASHNPHHDNGIKFFGPDGFKLSDAAEAEIEALLRDGVEPAPADRIGRAKRIDDGRFRYVERAKASFPPNRRLSGLKVVIDCANGAAYRTAPQVLWELGAELVEIGVSPNGLNINLECGSTNVRTAAEAVVAHGADVGLCLDGDADRIMVIDEKGAVADGDQLMALLAASWSQKGMIKGDGIVATVMSNLGLERYLEGHGMRLERAPVGDRYVVERMRQKGWNLGGEQSGHIVMTDFATTGDGLVAGLQFLAAMVEMDKPASELARQFEPVPQMLENVRYAPGGAPLESADVRAAIASGEERLGGQGRLLIRKSGTEPLIRVMGESEDESLLSAVIHEIVAALEAA